MKAVVLNLALAGAFCSDICRASDICQQQTGVRVSLVTKNLTNDTVKFSAIMENIGKDGIVMDKNSVPWFNSGRFFFVLLDEMAGHTLEDRISLSRIKFDEERPGRGHFAAQMIKKALSAYGGELKRGSSFSTEIEFSVSPGNFVDSESGIKVLRRDGVFLWSMQVQARGEACTQYGLSSIDLIDG